MTASSAEKLGPVSNIRLYGLATLVSFVGVGLVVAEAALLVPKEKASAFLLALTLFSPFAVFLLMLVMPSRVSIDAGARYEWHRPVIYINLGVPILLCVLILVLVGVSRDFDSISGLAIFLAAIAGSHLKSLVRCLLLEREGAKARDAKSRRSSRRAEAP